MDISTGTNPEPTASSDQFCRICLLQQLNLTSLMERIDGVMIAEMLYKLCSRQIEVQEGYPRSICQRCLSLLDCSFKFLNEFHQQDERLRSFYWSGSVMARLREYQDEGMKTVDERLENLARRKGSLFGPEAPLTSHKGTNTDPLPMLVNASTFTETPKEDIFEEPITKSEVTEEHESMDDFDIDEHDIYFTYSDGNDSESKEEQLVEMKIDVLQPVASEEQPETSQTGSRELRKLQHRAPRYRAEQPEIEKASPETNDKVHSDTEEHAHEQDENDSCDDSEVALEMDEEEHKIDPLLCYICDHTVESTAQLEKHLFSHSLMLPYECKLCMVREQDVPPTMDTLTALHNHFRTHQYPFQCEHCPKRFRRKAYLTAHEECHGDERFQCDECGRKFSHRRTWQSHIKRHAAVQMELFKCTLCDKVFGNSARLERHVRVHGGDGVHICKYCDKRFGDRRQLQNHIAQHAQQMLYVCEFCDQSYSNARQLDEHKIDQHLRGDELDEFLVTQGKRMRRVSLLKDKRCPFPDCDYVANTYGAMYVHKRTKHQPVHQCDMCEKSFAFLNQLKVHMKLHTGEKPFHCEICGRSFRRGFSYREHMEMHSTDANYSCTTCGKSFKRPRYLQAHMQTHDSLRKFPCEICGNCYKTNGELKKHTRNKHQLEHSEEITESIEEADDSSGVSYVVNYI